MEEDYSRPKLIKFHSLEAKKLAIDLQALHSNIFPHELSGEYAEAATNKLLPFAFHTQIAPNQGLIPLNLGGQPGDVFQ